MDLSPRRSLPASPPSIHRGEIDIGRRQQMAMLVEHGTLGEDDRKGRKRVGGLIRSCQ